MNSWSLSYENGKIYPKTLNLTKWQILKPFFNGDKIKNLVGDLLISRDSTLDSTNSFISVKQNLFANQQKF